MWAVVAYAACDKGSKDARATEDEVPRALAEYAAKEAAGAKNLPPLERLALCKLDPASEPLAAICRLGQPADRARFECSKPEVLGVCRALSLWICKHASLPALRFEAAVDYTGPAWKDGEAVDTSAMPFVGPVRAIKVHFKEPDSTQREALATTLRARLKSDGLHDGRGKDFQTKVTSSEYTEEVSVHAWLDGYKCP